MSLDLLAIVAIFCSAGFLVAGVLSSQIVSTANISVLAQSSYCGFTDQNTNFNYRYVDQAVQESIRYAHECYDGNGSSRDPACQIYQTQSIPFDTTYDTNPFEEESMTTDNRALKMDTGLQWSDAAFGINTLHTSALAVRQVSKCAPLNATKYQKIAPMDQIHSEYYWKRQPLPGEMMVTLDLGPKHGEPVNDTFTRTSATLNSLVTYEFGCISWFNESIEHFQASPWTMGTLIDLVTPLRATNSDVSIFVMSLNKLFFASPVDDPFFAAHQPQFYRTGDGTNLTAYGADQLQEMIGCTQQYQFCTPKNQCTDLTSVMTATYQAAANLDLDPIQNVTLYMFANALINFSTGYGNLVDDENFPLLAKDGGNAWLTVGLPANQWELEVQYWTSITLATLQRFVTDFATGQGISGKQYDSQENIPSGPYESLLCHAQKMKAPDGFSNINVFGLSLTIALCGTIILVDLSLPGILRCVSGTRKQKWAFVEKWNQQGLSHFWDDTHAASTNTGTKAPTGPAYYNTPVITSHKATSNEGNSTTVASSNASSHLDPRADLGSDLLSGQTTASTITASIHEEQSQETITTATDLSQPRTA